MAGVLIHDVSGYTGEKYNLKIPSLTDPANIQEAMMLFHYGIDNYDGSIEPANDSVFGNLRDFDDRIAQLEETEVVQLDGTSNQIVSSGSVGFVTLSLPDELITPGTFEVSGSSSFVGNALFQNEVVFESTAKYPQLVSPSEKFQTIETGASSTVNLDAKTTSLKYINVDSTGNWTFNIRGDSSTTLNSMLDNGESITVACLVTSGSPSYYPTGYQIDGSSITPYWQGDAVPENGNDDSIDAYSFTVLKTANATFRLLASQTQFKQPGV